MNRPFLPAFGHKPEQLAGRAQEISDFVQGLATKPGDWHRTTLVSGHKGMGKTTLSLELAAWATASGFEVLTMPEQEDWSALFLQRVTKGPTLVIVDGVHAATSALRSLTSAYQHAMNHDLSCAIVVTGEPRAFEALLEDSVLSALRKSHRVRLGALPTGTVQSALRKGLSKIGRELPQGDAAQAARVIKGHPYLLQLVGSYLSDEQVGLDEALECSKRDFADNLVKPMLERLSARDIDVLSAMAACGAGSQPVSIAELRAELGMADNYLQPYRARLLKAGVIKSPRRGQLEFAIPYLEAALPY